MCENKAITELCCLEKERSSMQTYFNSHRQILPAMCIMTSLNPKQSLWSEEGPARVVVQRMKAVAKTSLQYLQSRFMSGEVNIEVSADLPYFMSWFRKFFSQNLRILE